MLTKNHYLINRFFILTLVMILFSTGCEKNDEDEQDNQNGSGEIDFEINYGTVSDIDGNNYNTIVIGNQEWMAENLEVTRYNNGDSLSCNLSNNEWSNTTEGACTFWDKDTAMLQAYGMLYNWYAVNNSKNICPQGWRVPNQYDWDKLSNYLIDNYDEITTDNVGNYLKSCRQQGSPLGGDCDTQEHPVWNGHDTHYGTDDFGFSAIPGGMRENNGDYTVIGYGAFYWTANEVTDNEAVAFGLIHNTGELEIGGDGFNAGFSIRCIKE